MTSVTRRQALLLLASLAAVGCSPSSPADAVLGERAHLAAAREIGRVWLATLSEPPTTEQLLETAVGPDTHGWDPSRVQAVIHQRVRDDFAKGRTTKLSGWILSNTELAVYAIASRQPG